MTHQQFKRTRSVWALTLGAALACTAAYAADKTARSDAQARYQQERAACMKGQTNESRHDCLYEAQSAFDEARRGVLGDGMNPSYDANQKARCEPLRSEEHDACVARMNGQGTVSGSVGQGGIYRELVTTEPATEQPAAVQPDPQPAPAAGSMQGAPKD